MSIASKMTPAWRLWHVLYPMNIQRKFKYSAEYLEKVGIGQTGDPTIDRNWGEVYEIYPTSVAGAALLTSEGMPLDSLFVNPDDEVKAYNDITAHLQGWHLRVYEGCHPADAPPIEELELLESLAEHLHVRVKRRDPEHDISDSLFNRFLDMNRRRNPNSTMRYIRSQSYTPDGKIKPYRPFCERIARLLAERRNEY